LKRTSANPVIIDQTVEPPSGGCVLMVIGSKKKS